MVNDLTFFERKKYVVRYVTERPLSRDVEEWARITGRTWRWTSPPPSSPLSGK